MKKKYLIFLFFLCQIFYSQVEHNNAKILIKYKNEATGLDEIYDPQVSLFRASTYGYYSNKVIVVKKDSYELNGTIEHLIPDNTSITLYEIWNNGLNGSPFTGVTGISGNHLYSSDGVRFNWHQLNDTTAYFKITWGTSFAKCNINYYAKLFNYSDLSYFGGFNDGNNSYFTYSNSSPLVVTYQDYGTNPAYNLPDGALINWAIYNYGFDLLPNPVALQRGSFNKSTSGNAIPTNFSGRLVLSWNNPNTPFSSAMNNYFFSSIQIQNTTSLLVDDETKMTTIKVFPNPTKDVLKIDSSLSIEKVTIFDINGRRVLSVSKNNKEIDVSKLEKGAYIISIHFEDNTQKSEKFIKE